MEWNGMTCLDSRRLCLPAEQPGFPNCSLVRGNIVHQTPGPEVQNGIQWFYTSPSWLAWKSSCKCNAGGNPWLKWFVFQLGLNFIPWEPGNQTIRFQRIMKRMRKIPLSVLHVPTILSYQSHGVAATRGGPRTRPLPLHGLITQW